MQTTCCPTSLADLQATFLALVLPRVLSHGRVYFRYLKCPHRKEDALQEMIALAWKWHLRLAEKGQDGTCFPTAIASYAARAVRSGRRVCGQVKTRDVFSPLAQQRHGFAVGKLMDFETLTDNPITEALHDNTQSPPDVTVCFKLDFAAWQGTLTERDQCIVTDLMVGERTTDVADKYCLSPGRISQMRRELCQDWQTFCGDAQPTAPSGRPYVV